MLLGKPTGPKLQTFLWPFGACCNQGKIVVFKFVGPTPRTLYEFPVDDRVAHIQIACEEQSDTVAVVSTYKGLTEFRITWLSEGEVRDKRLRLSQACYIATYIYRGDIIVVVPEWVRVESAEDMVVFHRQVGYRFDTMVFPDGVAVGLGSPFSVISQNALGGDYYLQSKFVAGCYSLRGTTFVPMIGRCCRFTPTGDECVARVNSAQWTIPVVVHLNDTLQLMLIGNSMVTMGDVAFLLPSVVLPRCFVLAEQGVYFDCFNASDCPGIRVMSYYSFANNTITDFLISSEGELIREFPPREALEWEFVAKNPHRVPIPRGVNSLPDDLRIGIRHAYNTLESCVQVLEEARRASVLLLQAACGGTAKRGGA